MVIFNSKLSAWSAVFATAAVIPCTECRALSDVEVVIHDFQTGLVLKRTHMYMAVSFFDVPNF